MRRCLSLAAALLLAVACREDPEPLGEALVVVQTDVGVPLRVNRVRIEVLDGAGALVDTREVVTPTAADWPVSFSVVLPEGAAEGDALVRLRAYPEGHELPAREIERIARQPPRNITVYPSIDEACRNAPALRLAEPLTLRRGSTPITTLLGIQGCPANEAEETRSGSAVARLEIVEAGDYRIEVIGSVPDGANREEGSDSAISLRKDCPYATTQIACGPRQSDQNRLSVIERVTLTPGVYFVVTGGRDPAPADLTLLASRLDVFQPAPSATPPPLTADPGALDPSPGATIDRLVAIRLRPGERGRVDVTLHGECFGTPADLAARTSCVDTAGVRVPLAAEIPRGELTQEPRPPPPWQGDEIVGCAGPERPHEVCIPGGAFMLGDTLALEDLELRSQPERMRVVEPFFLDRYEMSVGRYREALRAGFSPPDGTPLENPQKTLTVAYACTWSAADLGRERLPLNCITWTTARALCAFFGGDLPTEDEWEYAATRAAREVETPYPWGRELPTCQRTVFGRMLQASAECPNEPFGPVAVDDELLVRGDVTPLGVVGLAGNIQEMLATAFVRYVDPAWERAGLRGALEEAEAPLRSARGADFSSGSNFATASTRRSEPVAAAYSNVGFRCARRGR